MPGWQIDEARAAKDRAVEVVVDALRGRDVASAQRLGGVERAGEPGLSTVGVAVGLAPQPDGGFGLAVRYRLGTPTARMITRRITGEVGPEVDVRRTGRIWALSSLDCAAAGGEPVVAALAAGETRRARPLRPGISIAHTRVTAGTLGGFARFDGVLHALSNHHVLVGDDGQLGDDIVQPGPYDGGVAPEDRVGQLAHAVELRRGEPAAADAALAVLDDDVVDTSYPGGPLAGIGEVEGGELVEKLGRTTGHTRGRVSAIELDDVLVGFGGSLGTLSFDGQIEVEGAGAESFSRGGDSGSLVYRADERTAIGLLFAGSETGGANGLGLTYLNPIGVVLEALGATLVV